MHIVLEYETVHFLKVFCHGYLFVSHSEVKENITPLKSQVILGKSELSRLILSYESLRYFDISFILRKQRDFVFLSVMLQKRKRCSIYKYLNLK